VAAAYGRRRSSSSSEAGKKPIDGGGSSGGAGSGAQQSELSQLTLEQRQEQVLAEGVAQIGQVMLSHPIVVGMQAACLTALVPLLETEHVRRQAQDSPLGHAVVAALRNFSDRVDVQVCF
jgi:hypothetical protein